MLVATILRVDKAWCPVYPLRHIASMPRPDRYW